jgi:hypothetical protein
MNRLASTSSLQQLVKQQHRSLVKQQKRGLYFAIPVLVPAAICAFVGITFWQVYKKRQLEELQAQGKAPPPSTETKEKNEDPRLR